METVLYAWPTEMSRLFTSKQTLNYVQRFKLTVFLYGNGMSPGKIYTILKPRLRDQSAQRHIRAMLTACKSANMQHKLHYFNIDAQDVLTLCGKEYGIATGSRIYTRKVNSFETFVNVCASRTNKYPTLHDQNKYMSSESIDAFEFFGWTHTPHTRVLEYP